MSLPPRCTLWAPGWAVPSKRPFRLPRTAPGNLSGASPPSAFAPRSLAGAAQLFLPAVVLLSLRIFLGFLEPGVEIIETGVSSFALGAFPFLVLFFSSSFPVDSGRSPPAHALLYPSVLYVATCDL